MYNPCVITPQGNVHDVLRWAYSLEARIAYPTKRDPFRSSPSTDGSLSFLERRAEAALVAGRCGANVVPLLPRTHAGLVGATSCRVDSDVAAVAAAGPISFVATNKY